MMDLKIGFFLDVKRFCGVRAVSVGHLEVKFAFQEAGP